MKKKFWLYVVLAVLYIAPYIALFQSIGKGDIKGGFNDEDRSNSTLVVTDTTVENAPVAISERFLGFDTIPLERADKRADSYGIKEKGEKRSELIKLPASECIPENSDSGTLVASYGQVTGDVKEDYFPMINSCDTSNTVDVLLSRVQRKYEDSAYTVWVSGYDPILDSVWVYNQKLYYPVVEKRETKPPPVVVTIGPYMGYGNKGFSYGLAITLGIPIPLKWPWW